VFYLKRRFSEFFHLVPEDELHKADSYLRSLTVRWMRAIAVLMAASTLVLWPSDYVLFLGRPDYQSTLTVWRTVLSGATLLLAFGLTYSTQLRQHPVLAFFFSAVAVMGVSGIAVGRLGGIDNPFFYAVYPIPATTVALLVPLRERVVATLSIAVFYLAGFVWAVGLRQLSLEFLGPVIFLAASSAGMVFIGHVVYRLVGSNYVREQRLQELIQSKNRELALATREALTAHENVRGRILRDLHDNIGPVITALHLEAFATRQALGQAVNPKEVALEYLSTVDGQSSTLKRLIRGTLRDLDPYGIERGTLIEVINNTLTELGMRRTHDLHCALERTINDLSPDIKQALHLILRECANNTVKHARASRVDIQAGIKDGTVHILYTDNGVGFNWAGTELAGADRKYGLTGIRLRAIDIGGQAELTSSPGNGFSLRLQIPLRAQAQEAVQ
jgi:signal transduction histidine kinase